MRALLALLVLTMSSPASAHHSFAMYDPAQLIHIQGTVKSFQWTNPHVMVWVVRDEPAGEVWTIELPTSPGNLARIGWSKHSLKPGTKVDVEVSPLRDGQHAGSFKKATLLETGEVLLASVAGGDGKDAGADGGSGAPPATTGPSCGDDSSADHGAAPSSPGATGGASATATAKLMVTGTEQGGCALADPRSGGAAAGLYALALVAGLRRARRRGR